MVSETRDARDGERRRSVLRQEVLSRKTAAFVIVVVCVTAIIGLASALGPVPGGGLALMSATVATFAAVGVAMHRLVRELQAGALQYRSILDTAPQSFIAADPHGQIVEWNRQAEREFGWAREEVIGRPVAEVLVPPRLRAEYGERIRALPRADSSALLRRRLELQALHRDGHEFPVEVRVSGLRTPKGYRFNAFLHDIVDRKLAEAKLAHQAMHDSLTGLPNRTLFNDRLALAKARMMRGGSVAVLFCDLDRFKRVNDDFGHAAGDRLLLDVATRLRSNVRPSDTVARFGGDEFALLCEGVDLEHAERIAFRIQRAFEEPFAIDGRQVAVTVSIGIVVTSDPAVATDQLIGDADFAMYAAKQEGRARHVVFGRRLRRSPAFAADDRRSRRGERRSVRPGTHS
jgi:diguanylate cyclase (GGDEF)-like protein/PAS domain S-box-containing protein